MKLLILTVCVFWFSNGNLNASPIDQVTDKIKGFATGVQSDVTNGIVQAIDGKKGVTCLEIKGDSCPTNSITYWLYTSDAQENPYQMDPSNGDTIRDAPFLSPAAPLKILVHGYTMDRDKAINNELRPAYWKNGKYNIISVDWAPLCIEHCYKSAAHNVPKVGKCLAGFIKEVVKQRKDDFTDLHLLGHSLGAHVTSWASKNVQLARLTEFDPALPLFSDKDTDLFTKPVADMADVWHSNSRIKGRDDASGTVDIFFNNEMDQPGCKCKTGCSHLRAVQYFAETVSSKKPLQAFPCNGYEDYSDGKCTRPAQGDLRDFGETFTAKTQGEYLAFTNDASPFIISATSYTDQATFDGFKDKQEKCPTHEIIATLGVIIDDL